MNEEYIQEIINANFRYITLLGYSLGLLETFKSYSDVNLLTGYDRAAYEWYKTAIHNIIYLKKPPPPLP